MGYRLRKTPGGGGQTLGIYFFKLNIWYYFNFFHFHWSFKVSRFLECQVSDETDYMRFFWKFPKYFADTWNKPQCEANFFTKFWNSRHLGLNCLFKKIFSYGLIFWKFVKSDETDEYMRFFLETSKIFRRNRNNPEFEAWTAYIKNIFIYNYKDFSFQIHSVVERKLVWKENWCGNKIGRTFWTVDFFQNNIVDSDRQKMFSIFTNFPILNLIDLH